MLNLRKINTMTNEELLKEYYFYKEQVQMTFSNGKSTVCALNLAYLAAELTRRNIPHTEAEVALSLELDDLNGTTRSLEKITIVLDSFDEELIKEAIKKSYYLDLKKLTEEDTLKTIAFFMECAKEEAKLLCFPDVMNPFLVAKTRAYGMSMSYFNGAHALIAGKTKDGMKNSTTIHSQPKCDYRKFEKRKWI